MLDYQTRFPASLFDQAALEDLVPRLAAMAGVEIEIETVCIVSTNDVGFSGMLDAIAEGKGRKKNNRFYSHPCCEGRKNFHIVLREHAQDQEEGHGAELP